MTNKNNSKRFSSRLLRHSRRLCSKIFSTICKECKSYIPLCYPMGTPMRRRRSFPGNSGIVQVISLFINIYSFIFKNFLNLFDGVKIIYSCKVPNSIFVPLIVFMGLFKN